MDPARVWTVNDWDERESKLLGAAVGYQLGFLLVSATASAILSMFLPVWLAVIGGVLLGLCGIWKALSGS